MKRKYLLVLLLIVVALSISVSASARSNAERADAQGEVKSYVVLLEGLPIVAYDGSVDGYEATKPGKGGKINPNSAHVRKYEKFLESNQKASLAAAGVDQSAKINSYTVALNGYSALLTEDEVKEIEGQDGVVLVMKDEMRQRTTDSSPAFLGLDADGGPWVRGFNGEGVVVGVIDDGIWPEHPSFADDGSYSVLPGYAGLPCEFGNTAHNPDDAPFTCNNKLLGARQMLSTYRALIGADPDEFDSARDDNGHGTHTASTAAGNAGVTANVLGVERGTISGVAPRARVIAYKGLGNLGGFSSDLASAIDQAVADGVDVINYSIGSGSFAIGADDIAFLFAADAGVFAATSNGNSGPGAATTGSPASVPWLTSVGASTQNRYFQGSASSSDDWEFFGASITAGTSELPLVDSTDAGSELCIPGALDPSLVAGNIVLCKRGAIARIAKGYAVYLAGGAGMILYNANDGQSQVTDTHWVPSVHINNTDGLVIKSYIATSSNPVAQINGGEKISVDAPWMAAFSSRGPNRLSGDIVKPDITAPGVQILAGWSPFPDPGDVPGEYFAAIAGTSMSSPHIAGVFALLKQAHPDWSPAMAKSAIMTTAYQDVMKEDGVTPADPFDLGAGHVNPGGEWSKGSISQPGLVYDAGLFEYAAFTCGMDWGVFTPGSCDFLEAIGVPSESYNLNMPSIGIADVPGSKTVMRTVTSVAKENGNRTYHVSVEAPPGYDVTVSPSSFTLKRGNTATYEVTVTNAGAPAGEWRFGSLTWEEMNGEYSVYSPIAVRGALFAAPDAVTGSGESGSASFDVRFGYTGPYTAAPHGLSAQTITSGLAGQDPDQTYPSADDAFPGVQKFDFPISGAAYARWELVIPGPDDIDLFLEDSSGTIIAASTNGGTDELIELTLPADDTYTMVVHGWSVPNEPLPFDMYSWDVPLASGGNLVIDSAPASATAGTVGVIDLSWTGAAAGTNYGLVSHTDGSGLTGFTLIAVDAP
ncbi:MAG TPA: S8 family peptidase [Anaerolineae bacterium]|nr:S8 family peptidase [Anaerolineae bacterium]